MLKSYHSNLAQQITYRIAMSYHLCLSNMSNHFASNRRWTAMIMATTMNQIRCWNQYRPAPFPLNLLRLHRNSLHLRRPLQLDWLWYRVELARHQRMALYYSLLMRMRSSLRRIWPVSLLCHRRCIKLFAFACHHHISSNNHSTARWTIVPRTFSPNRNLWWARAFRLQYILIHRLPLSQRLFRIYRIMHF